MDETPKFFYVRANPTGGKAGRGRNVTTSFTVYGPRTFFGRVITTVIKTVRYRVGDIEDYCKARSYVNWLIRQGNSKQMTGDALAKHRRTPGWEKHDTAR